ncbi:uncharacterized protein LTR77_003615 [Saxophila tyrrhenica]|uniref:Uncharacterized protein n=1 Tax=Saxophila tyrrhenica TaxID=1690608 RepID=A0AAV9PEA5_9PEZI|nr:hypothetical protein LTR77_003615 [Saxophila tyrrhenica]
MASTGVLPKKGEGTRDQSVTISNNLPSQPKAREQSELESSSSAADGLMHNQQNVPGGRNTRSAEEIEESQLAERLQSARIDAAADTESKLASEIDMLNDHVRHLKFELQKILEFEEERIAMIGKLDAYVAKLFESEDEEVRRNALERAMKEFRIARKAAKEGRHASATFGPEDIPVRYVQENYTSVAPSPTMASHSARLSQSSPQQFCPTATPPADEGHESPRVEDFDSLPF